MLQVAGVVDSAGMEHLITTGMELAAALGDDANVFNHSN